MPQAKAKRIPEINLPEWVGTESTVIGNHILFVAISHDSDCSNPTDADGFGSIRSLSRRHINRISLEDAVQLLKTDPDVVPLSYYEHGQSLWMVEDLPAPAGVEFDWDGVRSCGIWIPDDCVRESYTGQDGLSRRDWMLQQAESACKVYTQWANGECYGYQVAAYLLRKEGDDLYDKPSDYRKVDSIFDDSCWGFIGHDCVNEEMRSVVCNALTELGFSKRAIATAMKGAANGED